VVDLIRNDYRVLIADDDAGFRDTLESILEPHFETIAVSSAERAIEVIEHEPIHLVLFDMHMHVLTGLEALQIVRQIREGLPCILITADLTDQLAAAARQAAAYAVMKKPVSRRDLLNQVSTAIRDRYHPPEMRDIVT
jgi:DNA-binding NtrC family response regulator